MRNHAKAKTVGAVTDQIPCSMSSLKEKKADISEHFFVCFSAKTEGTLFRCHVYVFGWPLAKWSQFSDNLSHAQTGDSSFSYPKEKQENGTSCVV